MLPYVELYHRALGQFGHQPEQPIGCIRPGTSRRPTIGRQGRSLAALRGDDDPHRRRAGLAVATRAQFEREAGPDGALCVGSPETVAVKIAKTVRTLGLSRFDMKYSNGTLPHETLMGSIGLFGTRVAPLVREALEGAAATLA